MGWFVDWKIYFFVDIECYVVYVYDYDLEIGCFSNCCNFIEFGFEGFFDGFIVDINDYFWVVMW